MKYISVCTKQVCKGNKKLLQTIGMRLKVVKKYAFVNSGKQCYNE